MRLRELSGLTLGEAFPDNVALADTKVVMYHGKSLALQFLSTPEPLTSIQTFVMQIARWVPSEYKLHVKEELIVPRLGSLNDVRAAIAKKLGVEESNVSLVKSPTSVSVAFLDVPTLDWDRMDAHVPMYSHPHYIRENILILYKLKDELLKTLTPEEETVWKKQKQTAISRYFTGSSSYSSAASTPARKEKALHISTS